VTQLVHVPHAPGMLRPEVLPEIEAQGFVPVLVTTLVSEPTAYSSWLRTMWHRGDAFIVCEQRVLPPPGALAALRDCPKPWCYHPIDRGHGPMPYCLGLARFSADLLLAFPDAADRALVRRGGEDAWRAGLLDLPPWRPDAARPPRLQQACVNPAVAAMCGEYPGPLWPSTVRYPLTDSELAACLVMSGVQGHEHQPTPVNLVDYSTRPTDGTVDRWWERVSNAV
jgi:hypothetical protein